MTYVSTCLADGAVGLWEFGEPSGSTATDQAGNSNGAYAGTFTLGQPGIPGGGGATALLCGATSAVATVPDVAAQRVVDTFTLEIWIKRGATQSVAQGLIGGAGGGTPLLDITAANVIELAKTSTSSLVNSTVTLTDTSSFHHIVATKAGTTVKLYLDGVDVTGTVTNATMVSTSGLGWKLIHDNVHGAPNGATVAMAAIYPTALSAATVANHYSLGSSSGSAPSNTVAPAVTGTATVGQVLSTTNGTWTDAGSPAFTYQWQRAGVNIGSATSSTYTLVDADDGSAIRCVVTDTDVNGATSANSNATAAVIEPAPSNSVAPALGGTNATVGSAITCGTGTWSNMAGAGGSSYTYQWRDSATSGGTYADISGATSSSYTVGSGEATKFLKCVVTAHNTNSSTGSATTVASSQVAAAPAADPAQKTNSSAPFLLITGSN